jgi:16S rRNA (adenine1518-N6/adenine1519-N6)-dimethyltransferase
VESAVDIHRPAKRLGQNFLKSLDVAERIVSIANPNRDDTVLEPGAGLGFLTRLLRDRAGFVIAVEKDSRLAARLRRTFSTAHSVEVIEGDVLKVNLPAFNKVVGTPPYYISSKLVLLLQGSSFAMAHLVFQKEFADRLLAKPGTRDYGRLSVTAQRLMTIRTLMDISRESFEPRPKVDSVLVSLEPKPYRTNVDAMVLGEMVRGIFTQRRRLARGALLHYLRLKLGPEKARTALSRVRIPDLRVYELSIEELEDIAVQLATSGLQAGG